MPNILKKIGIESQIDDFMDQVSESGLLCKSGIEAYLKGNCKAFDEALAAIRDLYGLRRLFGAPGTRPAFLDQLYGTDQVRTGLQAGAAWRTLTAAWAPACQPFLRERAAALLYRATP